MYRKRIDNVIFFLEKLPFLTKDIIAEQGDRLLSRPLAEIRSYACRTGGSTGRRCVVYRARRLWDRFGH